MKAVVVREAGGPEVLVVREVAVPEAGPYDVRVRVAAVGVNRADLIQRRGHYPAPPGWPSDVPGLEYAGVVETVGSAVRAWSVGDRVMGLVGGGGYAEFVVVDEREAVRVPEGLDLVAAAALPEVFMTAFDALFLQMGLAAGERLLVHAVGSGVGTAAVQLARAAGVTTIGTSRTPEKLERAADLGLEHGVLAGTEGWLEGVRAVAPDGVDVILALVGGPYLAQNVDALARGGRMVVVGVTGGASAPLDLRALMGRRGSITGTVLRARPREEKMALAQTFGRRVLPLLDAGTLEPVVDRIFPVEQAPDAHRYMEGNRNFGKIVLAWDL